MVLKNNISGLPTWRGGGNPEDGSLSLPYKIYEQRPVP
jgi:hypothetical protein